ncbi:YciI family protein [Saccharopolyspora mangrovi]|uniref:YciI family protein n=1 Tax=Saccharopolyspora mangrovi TaxID=3082379 RepID=A0ABU6AGN0_9PSEU|nr:YciI family protein [Saccharopolyspora sp. S2-29]MEB3370485.1 YciI family protein [Saccharopolyspora sp. S2-29]
MAVYAVTYHYTDDSAGRDEHRSAHKEFLSELGRRGINMCSGPFGPQEAAGALLLISATSRDEAVACTEEDPFRRHGLVAEVTVREWVPLLGRLAGELA